jgi:outer membrane receptor protein involved in Fe transport
MIYGSWSKGYKTGGWTTRLSNPLPTAPNFDEEKATTFEVGLKSTLIDRKLQLNAAIFTTKYAGIQLNFQQGVSPTIQNAGNARLKGFELELTAAPADGFLINASVGFTDSKYTSVLAPAQVAANPFQAGVFPGATCPRRPNGSSMSARVMSCRLAAVTRRWLFWPITPTPQNCGTIPSVPICSSVRQLTFSMARSPSNLAIIGI